MTRRGKRQFFGATRTPRIAIIGAGFGGIAAGVNLKRAGIESFTIFEKSDGVGGSWWDNTYPGAAVDTPSHLYSFSFKEFDWTRTHARQPEVRKYLEEVIDTFGLRPHFRLRTAVRGVVWDDRAHLYVVRTEGGDDFLCNVVISAVGLLNVPLYPDWPGLDAFKGAKFHTSRWEHDCDLAGKRVAVVGTGASAVQIVPAIAPIVEHLYVFQREPNWISPKNARDFTAEERLAFKRPFARKVRRVRLFLSGETRQDSRRTSSKKNQAARDGCLEYIGTVFADRPDLRELVTPTYPFFGKRPVIDDDFYPALLRHNVELIPRPVTKLTETGIVDAEGEERQIDVLVMATGFQAANILATLEIVGRDGRRLHEVWNGEPQAFLGITVAGFPNFYMIFGPNTYGGGSGGCFNIERQAEFAIRDVKRMMSRGITSIEVRKRYMAIYDRWLQRRLQRITAWTTTNNYFKSPSGRVVTQWPERGSVYWLMTRTLRVVSSTTRRAAIENTTMVQELTAGEK